MQNAHSLLKERILKLLRYYYCDWVKLLIFSLKYNDALKEIKIQNWNIFADEIYENRFANNNKFTYISMPT
jgi:hypothetical protein